MIRSVLLLSAVFLAYPFGGVRAQYRPAGGPLSGDIGRISIELPMKTPVYTATVQVFLGEQQVATRSMKKDSVGDKARFADIRNLKEGLYTLKIESPGMPDLLQQVFVRNEKDPVRLFIDYPANVIPASQAAPGAAPETMTDLLVRIQRLEERVEVLQKRPAVKTSSKRTKKPSTRGRTVQQPPPETQDELADPAQQPAQNRQTEAPAQAEPARTEPVRTEPEPQPQPVRAEPAAQPRQQPAAQQPVSQQPASRQPAARQEEEAEQPAVQQQPASQQPAAAPSRNPRSRTRPGARPTGRTRGGY